ncbi:MAG TPA: restriction endonuclease subunit S, partial [Pricia sp.]|nr:restriction endonuclease subunit S [Pricia sp.]
QIEQQAVVSSYKTISLKTIRGLKISLPPLPEQRVIASILSALDNKIENNLAMNKTLEDMAMALYKHWFVDFGPFQEGNFIDSELGPIPEGWEVKRLDDLCEKIYSGGTPKTKVQEYWNGSIPWLSSGETRANLILETEKTITQLGLDKSSSKMAYKYDIVIASAGQGKTRGQTSLLLIDTSVNQSVLCLRANKKKIHPLTLYYDLRFRYNQFRHISDSFSTRGSLTTKLIGEQILLAVPPIEHQIGFHGQLLKSMELQESNLLENISLIQLRDTSLPKLISGEVRVKDAEKLVSAAL